MRRAAPATAVLASWDGQLYPRQTVESVLRDVFGPPDAPRFEPGYVDDHVVELWRRQYDSGAVRGFSVSQAQGEDPKVGWTV